MAVVNAMKNGDAPPGSQVGDYVNTAAGVYQITQPGALGSSYNPSSGYWSTKRVPYGIQDVMSHFRGLQDYNNALNMVAWDDQWNRQESNAQAAMKFNAQQAQLNRDWQEYMSNTAHQREVADMMAAGLNPVLSAMGGTGAAVTSGAQASGVMPSGGQMIQSDTMFGNQLMSYLTSLIAQNTLLSTTKMSNENAIKVAYMNNKNALNLAAINNAAALKQTAMNNSTTLSTAQINSRTQLEVERMRNQFEEYMRKNYPNSLEQFGVEKLTDLWNFVEGLFTGGQNSSKEVDERIESFEPETWYGKLFQKFDTM